MVFLGDSRIAKDHRYEAGIAAQTLLLGAVESGLGGCILSSVDRDTLRTLYSVPSELEVLFVVAIGEPVEKVVVEPLAAGSDTRYWRDHDGVHHVPKRLLQDIIVEPHT